MYTERTLELFEKTLKLGNTLIGTYYLLVARSYLEHCVW